MIKRVLTTSTILAALLGAVGFSKAGPMRHQSFLEPSREGRRRKTTEKPSKVCLFCGNRHTHNNAFCSADCCRAYKVMKRQDHGK